MTRFLRKYAGKTFYLLFHPPHEQDDGIPITDILPLLGKTSFKKKTISFFKDVFLFLYLELQFSLQTKNQLVSEMTYPFASAFGSFGGGKKIGLQALLNEAGTKSLKFHPLILGFHLLAEFFRFLELLLSLLAGLLVLLLLGLLGAAIGGERAERE